MGDELTDLPLELTDGGLHFTHGFRQPDEDGTGDEGVTYIELGEVGDGVELGEVGKLYAMSGVNFQPQFVGQGCSLDKARCLSRSLLTQCVGKAPGGRVWLC